MAKTYSSTASFGSWTKTFVGRIGLALAHAVQLPSRLDMLFKDINRGGEKCLFTTAAETEMVASKQGVCMYEPQRTGRNLALGRTCPYTSFCTAPGQKQQHTYTYTHTHIHRYSQCDQPRIGLFNNRVPECLRVSVFACLSAGTRRSSSAVPWAAGTRGADLSSN